MVACLAAARDAPGEPTTAAATATAEIGGGGGTAGTSTCGDRAVLTGAIVQVASWLRQIAAVCTALTETGTGVTVVRADGEVVDAPSLGAAIGTEARTDCPARQVATGFGGREGLLVDGVHLLCRPLTPGSGAATTGPESQSTYVGGPGGMAVPDLRCPDGEVGVGLTGRAGDSLDAVAMLCARINPGTAVVSSISPAAAGTDPSPEIRGSARGGSTVRLYTNPACGGEPVATGPAADFASAGLTVTVPVPSVTTFYATASDVEGDGPPCSSTSVTYVALPTLPTCHGERATIIPVPGKRRVNGTEGADVIVANANANIIRGRGGDDLICARGGGDRINGGRGRDRIYGEGGNDRVRGGAEADRVFGGGGDDRMGGGSGNDRLSGGPGADRLDERRYGGSGRDKLSGGSGDDRISTAGGERDRVDCGPGDADRARVDRFDAVDRCEVVIR